MININRFSNIFNLNDKNVSFQKVFDAKFERIKIKNKNYLYIDQKVIEKLSEKAFFEISHFLRTTHLKKIQNILEDKNASNNDKYVANTLLKNASAVIAFNSTIDFETIASNRNLIIPNFNNENKVHQNILHKIENEKYFVNSKKQFMGKIKFYLENKYRNKSLSNADIKAIPNSIWYITFELAVRFLVDYLEGNKYFHVSHHTQNLERSLIQFNLLKDIEKKRENIVNIVQSPQ